MSCKISGSLYFLAQGNDEFLVVGAVRGPAKDGHLYQFSADMKDVWWPNNEAVCRKDWAFQPHQVVNAEVSQIAMAFHWSTDTDPIDVKHPCSSSSHNIRCEISDMMGRSMWTDDDIENLRKLSSFVPDVDGTLRWFIEKMSPMDPDQIERIRSLWMRGDSCKKAAEDPVKEFSTIEDFSAHMAGSHPSMLAVKEVVALDAASAPVKPKRSHRKKVVELAVVAEPVPVVEQVPVVAESAPAVAEPVSVVAEPVSVVAEPVSVVAEPVSVVAEQEPIPPKRKRNRKLKPVVTKVEPVAAEVEPVTAEVELVTAEPVSEPTPVSPKKKRNRKSKLVAAEVEPVAAEVEPVAAEAEPVAAEAEPVSAPELIPIPTFRCRHGVATRFCEGAVGEADLAASVAEPVPVLSGSVAVEPVKLDSSVEVIVSSPNGLAERPLKITEIKKLPSRFRPQPRRRHDKKPCLEEAQVETSQDIEPKVLDVPSPIPGWRQIKKDLWFRDIDGTEVWKDRVEKWRVRWLGGRGRIYMSPFDFADKPREAMAWVERVRPQGEWNDAEIQSYLAKSGKIVHVLEE
jgi:hypothetical protein